jgi:hypothetical protein
MPQAQARHIPCAAPLDEVTRSELLQAGAGLRVSQNVRQTKRGALENRLGFKSTSKARIDATSRTEGLKMGTLRGVPYVISSGKLDAYIDSKDTNVSRGRVSECTYRPMTAPVATIASIVEDAEVCNGFLAISSKSAGPYVAVLDKDTGATVLPPSKLSSVSAVAVKLASFSNRYFVAFVLAGTTVTPYILDTTALSSGWSSLATISNVDSIGRFSVCSFSDRVLIASAINTGVNRVDLRTYNASGLVTSTTISTASVTPDSVDVQASPSSATFWLVYRATDTFASFRTLSTLATAATTITLLVGAAGYSNVMVCEGATANAARFLCFSSDGGVKTIALSQAAGTITPGSTQSFFGANIISRPFYQGDRYYIACRSTYIPWAAEIPSDQRTLTLCDWSEDYNSGLPPLRPVGHFDPGLVLVDDWIVKIPASTTTKRLLAYATVAAGGLGGVGNITVAGARIAELDFASTKRWQSAEHNGSVYLGGALLEVFGGSAITEAGFLQSPYKPLGAGAGAGAINGTVRYVATFEDVDEAGNWVQSGVSEPSDEIPLVNRASIDVSLRPFAVSSRSRRTSCRIALWRTDLSGEPPYYRLDDVELDLTAATIAYSDVTDTIGGFDLTSHAKLYAPNLPGTAGESLDRRAPPGLPVISSFNGMLVGARGSSVFSSGQQIYGEATWFSPLFEQPLPGSGDIIALPSQDGTLFAMRETEIYALAGEPPSDNGTSGGIGAPRKLSSDVGCINPDSVVVTSLGIFFQSLRGIELLSRAQAVEPIGDPVSPELATYPIVTAAVLDDENGLVRISLTDATGTNGVDLVFDLLLKVWVSVDTKRGSIATQRTVAACMVNVGSIRRYAWLGSDGTVYVEQTTGDVAPWLDNGTFVTPTFTTGQFNFGPQQEQHVYEMQLLCERYSAAGLQINIIPDYNPAAPVTVTLTEAATLGKRQLTFGPDLKGMSFALQFTATAPAVLGTGRGFSFVAISSDMAPVQGYTRGTPRIAGRQS